MSLYRAHTKPAVYTLLAENAYKMDRDAVKTTTTKATLDL